MDPKEFRGSIYEKSATAAENAAESNNLVSGEIKSGNFKDKLRELNQRTNSVYLKALGGSFLIVAGATACNFLPQIMEYIMPK